MQLLLSSSAIFLDIHFKRKRQGEEPLHFLRPAASRQGRAHWRESSNWAAVFQLCRDAENIWNSPLGVNFFIVGLMLWGTLGCEMSLHYRFLIGVAWVGTSLVLWFNPARGSAPHSRFVHSPLSQWNRGEKTGKKKPTVVFVGWYKTIY